VLEQLGASAQYVKRMRNHERVDRLIDEARLNPDGELSDEDLRFVYGLDEEVLTLDDDQTVELAKTIDYLRAGKDRERIARLFPEVIKQQVQSAHVAYLKATSILLGKGEVTASLEELEALFATKDKEWQTNGVYDYLVEQLLYNDSRFNLVASPNIEATEAQILELAENFGHEQSRRTHVKGDLFGEDYYSSQELSGNKGDAPIRLSLIPTRIDSEMSHETRDKYSHLLRERQALRPELHLRVPSVLDAITYWYTCSGR
jgi:hypothetical protein